MVTWKFIAKSVITLPAPLDPSSPNSKNPCFPQTANSVNWNNALEQKT